VTQSAVITLDNGNTYVVPPTIQGSVPLAVGISGLEILVVLIQAYVFTLLTAVFIGMAIHVHH